MRKDISPFLGMLITATIKEKFYALPSAQKFPSMGTSFSSYNRILVHFVL
jgi:hypothetical protein